MDRPSSSPPDSVESAFSQKVFKIEEFCDWLMQRTDLNRVMMLGQLQSVARRAGFKRVPHLAKWCIEREKDGKLFVYVGLRPAARFKRREYEILLKADDVLAAKRAAREKRIQQATQRAARHVIKPGVEVRTGPVRPSDCDPPRIVGPDDEVVDDAANLPLGMSIRSSGDE